MEGNTSTHLVVIVKTLKGHIILTGYDRMEPDMTAREMKQVSHQFLISVNHDLVPKLAVAGAILFVAGLVVGVI